MTAATPLDVVNLLRSGGGALLAQALLHAELAGIEWQEEKQRLLRLLVIILLGFTCVLGGLLFAGLLVLAAAWDTTWRLPMGIAVVLLYVGGAATAWRHLQATVALGEQAFAASRAELAADAALLRGSL
jgi:uncharacterized membrane protein YqjE